MVDEAPKDPSSQDSSSKLDTLKRKVKDLHADPRVGGLKKFLQHHMREAIGGVLTLVGIIVSLPAPSWGGLFVALGSVLGFYPEISAMLVNIKLHFAKNGPAKNALLCGLLLFFLIKAFAFTVTFIVLCVLLMFLSKEPCINKSSNDQ